MGPIPNLHTAYNAMSDISASMSGNKLANVLNRNAVERVNLYTAELKLHGLSMTPSPKQTIETSHMPIRR